MGCSVIYDTNPGKTVPFQGNGFRNTHSWGSCMGYTLNPSLNSYCSDFLEMWLVVGGVKENQPSNAGFAPTARIHRNWAPLALLRLLLLQLKSFLVLKLVGDKDH